MPPLSLLPLHNDMVAMKRSYILLQQGINRFAGRRRTLAPHKFAVREKVGFLATTGFGECISVDQRYRRKCRPKRFQRAHATSHHQAERMRYTRCKFCRLRTH